MLTKHGVSMAGCECQHTSREDWVVVAVLVVGCDAEDTAVEGPSWHSVFGLGLKSESESESASDSSLDSEHTPSLGGVQASLISSLIASRSWGGKGLSH